MAGIPIRYLPDDPAVAQLAALADRHFDPHGYALHYASVGLNSVKRWFEKSEAIPAKRLFYALRPALCIRALRLIPHRRPPMRFQDPMAITELPLGIVNQIEELVELKAQQREKAGAHRSPEVEALIHSELDRAREIAPRACNADFMQEADQLFREIVRTKR